MRTRLSVLLSVVSLLVLSCAALNAGASSAILPPPWQAHYDTRLLSNGNGLSGVH